MGRTRNLRAPGPRFGRLVGALLAIAALLAVAASATGTVALARPIDALHAQVAADVEVQAATSAPRAPEPAAPAAELLVRVPRDLAVRAHPNGSSRVVGTMPSGSRFYDVAITAWVERLSPDGRWG